MSFTMFLGGWHVSRPLVWKNKNHLCGYQPYRDSSRAGSNTIRKYNFNWNMCSDLAVTTLDSTA